MSIPGSREQFSGHVEAKKAGDQPKGTEGLKRQLSESIFGNPSDREESQIKIVEGIRNKANEPTQEFVKDVLDSDLITQRQNVNQRLEQLNQKFQKQDRAKLNQSLTLTDEDRLKISEFEDTIQAYTRAKVDLEGEIKSLTERLTQIPKTISKGGNKPSEAVNSAYTDAEKSLTEKKGELGKLENKIKFAEEDKTNVGKKEDATYGDEIKKDIFSLLGQIEQQPKDQQKKILKHYVQKLAINEYNRDPGNFNFEDFKKKYLTTATGATTSSLGLDSVISTTEVDDYINEVTSDAESNFRRANIELIDMLDNQGLSPSEALSKILENNKDLSTQQKIDLEKKIQLLGFETGEISMREVLNSKNFTTEQKIDYLENFYDPNEDDLVDTLQLIRQLQRNLQRDTRNKTAISRSRFNAVLDKTVGRTRFESGQELGDVRTRARNTETNLTDRLDKLKKKIVANEGIRLAEKLGNDFDTNALQLMKDQLIVLNRENDLGLNVDSAFNEMVGNPNEDGSLTDWFQQQRAIKVYDNLEAQLANGDIKLNDLSGKGNALTGELKRLVDSNQISEILANKVRDELRKQVLEIENITTEEFEHNATMDLATIEALAQEKGLTDDEKRMMELQAEGIKMLSGAETDYLAKAYRGVQEKILKLRKFWINIQRGFVKGAAIAGVAGLLAGAGFGIAAATPFAGAGAAAWGLGLSGVGVGALVMSYKWNHSRVSNVYKYQSAVASMNQQAVMRGNIMRASTVYQATQTEGVSKDLIKAGLREKNIDPEIMDKVKSAKDYLNYINEQIIGTSKFLGDNQRRRFNLA